MDKETETNQTKRRVKTQHPCTYEGCTAVFSKNCKLQEHIRRHTGERPFACEEPNCNKTYLYAFHLRRHNERLHLKTASQEQIKCPHEGCYFELANKYSLKKHIKRKHTPLKCDICHQEFFKKQQLLKHSYVHTGILPYKCEKCDLRFPGRYEKNRHMRTHSTYICFCGDIYERWSQLLQHKKVCGKMEYNCKVCDRPFKKPVNLQRHVKLHFSDGSEKFYCGYDKCKRFYLHKNNLTYHINSYHKCIEKKRVYCGYQDCNENFTRKQNLILHIGRVHTNTKAAARKKQKIRKDKGVCRNDMAEVLVGLPSCPKITAFHNMVPTNACNDEDVTILNRTSALCNSDESFGDSILKQLTVENCVKSV